VAADGEAEGDGALEGFDGAGVGLDRVREGGLGLGCVLAGDRVVSCCAVVPADLDLRGLGDDVPRPPLVAVGEAD
jgi:hypothetical protein